MFSCVWTWIQAGTSSPLTAVFVGAREPAPCKAAVCAGTECSPAEAQAVSSPSHPNSCAFITFFCPSSMTAGICLKAWQSLGLYTPGRQRNRLAFVPEPGMRSPHCEGDRQRAEVFCSALGTVKPPWLLQTYQPKALARKPWPWGKEPQGCSLLFEDQNVNF